MKYVIKFSKRGRMAFISHLDLSRTFLRALRASGIRPSYSEGFNPHPKMSFALPLSLGFESVSEYLDVETETEVDLKQAAKQLNERLPNGIEVTGVIEKDVTMNGTLAAHVSFAEYEILAPFTKSGEENPATYLAQKSIIIEKESRKTGKVNQMDIKPQIAAFEKLSTFNSFITYRAKLASASGNLLNPKALLESYYKFHGLQVDLSDISVMRTSIILS
jgi:radical SAM-linked protein